MTITEMREKRNKLVGGNRSRAQQARVKASHRQAHAGRKGRTRQDRSRFR